MIEPVVSPHWVRAHRDDVVLVDVRWYLDGRSGQDAHLAGHIPGAVWADLDTDLSAPPSVDGGRHPVPSPEAFAQALGQLGIGSAATVVAYDDSSGAYAARLVWLLRLIGQQAALLDGGLQAWQGHLEQGAVTLPAVDRAVAEWPAGAFRTADDLAHASIVLDARAPERYSGASVLPTDVRSGHIPGARNAPWAENLDKDGTFAPVDRLRAIYREHGVEAARDPNQDVVVYCGSGVTACHDLLALERIGVRAALYPGSWSAWSADPARDIAVGPSTGNGGKQ
jgi:thiosulfate/3-mercaptopyruvate sulfurtransferase